MSQFYTPSPMPATIPAMRLTPYKILAVISTLGLLTACSTPGQQLASKEIQAVNAQEMKCGPNTPYLGAYNSTDAPRLSTDTPYDALNPQLSETVALPFFSFLIIEPEPVTKNAVPADIEKLVKAQQYEDAIQLIDARLKKTPKNVQLRFLKARLQIEMHQFDQAKKTLIEITQQFPELPEPYNNLAALAANQNKWIEARDYLELALKLRPSYTAASANLGEVYVRLAAKSYDDAANSTQLNKRLYETRAKALMALLKPTAKSPANPTPSTNPPESKSK